MMNNNNKFVYVSEKPYVYQYPYPIEILKTSTIKIRIDKGCRLNDDDYKYYLLYETNINNSISTPTLKNITITKIEIDIHTIDDIINLALNYGTKYPKYNTYNINLELISNLLEELYLLKKMIGQNSLKRQILDIIIFYSLDLHTNKDDILHTIIDGSPGSGKTEFAHIIAKIYLKLGILKNGIFKKVRRSDLIAGYLGQTAIKTQKILDEVRGGVLFIDEAYSLGNGEGKDTRDIYSKECIDLLNQSLTEMLDSPDKYFICMIAGYKEDLSKNFFSLNDGLERRFTIHFRMEEYTDSELFEIFKLKTTDNGWNIDNNVDSNIITEYRAYFQYSGGDMDTLFSKCKIAHARNLIKNGNKIKKLITYNDILDGINIFIQNKKNLNIHDKEYKNLSMYS